MLNGPYLIKDPADYQKLLDSDWFKEIEKKLDAAGFKLIMANGFFGQRHLIADKPVRKPEDIAGMTVRVPPNPMWIETFKAMGARPDHRAVVGDLQRPAAERGGRRRRRRSARCGAPSCTRRARSSR